VTSEKAVHPTTSVRIPHKQPTSIVTNRTLLARLAVLGQAGSLIGLLLWPGGLLSALHVYVPDLVGAPSVHVPKREIGERRLQTVPVHSRS